MVKDSEQTLFSDYLASQSKQDYCGSSNVGDRPYLSNRHTNCEIIAVLKQRLYNLDLLLNGLTRRGSKSVT